LVRRGKYRPSGGGPTYSNKDNVRLKVILYLLSNGKAIKNDFQTDKEAGLRGQEWNRFVNILEEMRDLGWIKESPSVVANVLEYELLDKGKEIALLAKKLREQNHPIVDLDVFYDVK
jgi:hypothetical protein